MLITSLTNPRIKRIVRLRDHQARVETGLTIVEGVREVSLALAAGIRAEEIYISPELLAKYTSEDIINTRVPEGVVFEVDHKIFEKIAFGDRREGILMVCQPRRQTLLELKVTSQSFFIIVENVEKPGNLGAILRTCDGAGVDALLIADTKTDVYNAHVIRSRLGTIFCVPVIQAQSSDLVHLLKKNLVRIVAASPAGEQIYYAKDYRGPVALVLGSEQEGLSEFWMQHADAKVKIPMAGKADSLNVSNTAAILAYEVQRQRKQNIAQ
jgi:RNA methyltransferase, TrmH family